MYRHKLIVSTFLNDLAILNHDNQIRIPNRGQPVRDYERCPALAETQHGPTNFLFRHRIDRAGGFIKD